MKSLKSFLRVSIFALIAFILVTIAVAALAAEPFLTLDAFSGKPGTAVTVSGGGFPAGAPISIFMGTEAMASLAVLADSIGFFSAPLTIPVNAPEGTLSIAGRTPGGSAALNSYFVQPFLPAITLNALQNTPGSPLLIDGSGFAPGEPVGITLSGATVETRADSFGAFTAVSLAIPSVAAGTYTVTAAGRESGARAPGFFYIGDFFPSASPSSYYALPDEALNFSGSGFAPGETISVADGASGQIVSTITASGDGSFMNEGALVIPLGWAGRLVPFRLEGAASRSPVSITVTVGQFLPFASPSSYFVLPGEQLSFSGGGFAAGEEINVHEGAARNFMGSFAADASGMFASAGATPVPFDFLGSVRTLHLAGARSGAGMNVTVTVGQFFAQILPSSFFAKPGSAVTVSGFGFSPVESVEVSLSGAQALGATADAFGKISAGPFTVPFTDLDSLVFSAQGLSSQTRSVSAITLGKFFPTVSPSAYYALPGSSISFDGAGFAPNETVSVSAGDPAAPTGVEAAADEEGAIQIQSIALPFGTPPGERIYTLTGEKSGASSDVLITVGSFGPWALSDDYFPMPGSVIHVTGFGFAPGETVSVFRGADSNAVGSGIASPLSGETDPIAVTIPFGAANSAHFELRGTMSGAIAALDLGIGTLVPGATADSYYAPPGTTIHVIGQGFSPGEIVRASLGAFSIEAAADQLGAAGPLAVPLPFDGASPATIALAGLSSGARTSLDVTLAAFFPSVTPSTYYARPGTVVSFGGSGFAANEPIALALNGANVANAVSDATGAVSGLDATLSNGPAGPLRFTVSGALSQTTAPVDITLAALQPGIILDTYYALGGAPLAITATGFAGNESVQFAFDGMPLGATASDSDGNAVLAAHVPFGLFGDKQITAVGQASGGRAVSPFTQARFWDVALELAVYAAAPGESLTFIGSGYAPDESIAVRADRTGSRVLHAFNAGVGGTFTDSSFQIPADFAPGLLTLTVAGKESVEPRDIVIYVTGG